MKQTLFVERLTCISGALIAFWCGAAWLATACTAVTNDTGSDAGTPGTAGASTTVGGAGSSSAGGSTGTGGGSGSDGSAGTKADAGTDGSSGSGGSAGSGSDAGSMPETSGSAPLVVGEITLHQNTVGPMAAYDAFVAFGATTSASMCTTTAMGSCSYVVCPSADGDGGTPMEISTPNAGTVTITGTGAPAMVTYGAVGDGVMAYEPVDGQTRFYNPGDIITVTGAGGPDLPAFGAQTVVAPSDIAVTSPVCGMTCPDLDRTKDLLVTWTGGGAGGVDVVLLAASDTATVLVTCTFPASSGTGSLPTAVLMKLPMGGDVVGLQSVIPTNHTDFTVGTVKSRFVVTGSIKQGSFAVSK